MLVYEFYWRDESGDTHLIGILPERRKNLNRVTNQSVMNWVKEMLGNEVSNIFFNRVTINDS